MTEQRRVAAAGPAVSVIIPHLNQHAMLVKCLETVVAQHCPAGPFEVIVVDNGSKTPLDAVAARFPQVRFIGETAPGPGLARNTGIAHARGSILAFIDADCTADAGWLAAAVTTVEATNGPVGGDVLVGCVDPARMTGVEAFESVFGYRQKLYIGKKNFSGTGNLAMTRAIFERVGPFAGIGTAEDMDWGRRATAAGYRFTYQPRMRIWHPARPDFGALQTKWQRHIAHDIHAHRAAGRPGWRWLALAGAVAASGIVDSVRLAASPRLSGPGNRLRGIGVLLRLRLWRAGEMVRLWRSGDDSGATGWNR